MNQIKLCGNLTRGQGLALLGSCEAYLSLVTISSFFWQMLDAKEPYFTLYEVILREDWVPCSGEQRTCGITQEHSSTITPAPQNCPGKSQIHFQWQTVIKSNTHMCTVTKAWMPHLLLLDHFWVCCWPENKWAQRVIFRSGWYVTVTGWSTGHSSWSYLAKILQSPLSPKVIQRRNYIVSDLRHRERSPKQNICLRWVKLFTGHFGHYWNQREIFIFNKMA